MTSLAALLAPLALLLSGPASPELAGDDAVRHAGIFLKADHSEAPNPGARDESLRWLRFHAPYRMPSFNQVRIERRVTIRISPRPVDVRRSLMAELPPRTLQPRFVEKKIGECLKLAEIEGVQPDGSNRLLLYLRGRRLISAELERSCDARAYYSGFYVEKNKDGKICIDRDELQSRSGARCELTRLRQLVAVSE